MNPSELTRQDQLDPPPAEAADRPRSWCLWLKGPDAWVIRYEGTREMMQGRMRWLLTECGYGEDEVDLLPSGEEKP
jgi:hypothetical protein